MATATAEAKAALDEAAELEVLRTRTVTELLTDTLPPDVLKPIVFKIFKSDNPNSVVYAVTPEFEGGVEVGLDLKPRWFKANPPHAQEERDSGNPLLLVDIDEETDPQQAKIYGVDFSEVEPGTPAAVTATSNPDASVLGVQLKMMQFLDADVDFCAHLVLFADGRAELRGVLDGTPVQLTHAYVNVVTGLIPSVASVHVYGKTAANVFTSSVIVPKPGQLSRAMNMLMS
jgi:hypothetical protein